MRVGHYLKALFPVGIGSPRITDVAEAVEVNAAGHEHGNENRRNAENSDLSMAFLLSARPGYRKRTR